MHEYIWHPKGHDWETLLLIEAHQKYEALWNRALGWIDQFREGLKMRPVKDAEFKKRFMDRG